MTKDAEYGGEGGIRTHAPITRPGSLVDCSLRLLGTSPYSGTSIFNVNQPIILNRWTTGSNQFILLEPVCLSATILVRPDFMLQGATSVVSFSLRKLQIYPTMYTDEYVLILTCTPITNGATRHGFSLVLTLYSIYCTWTHLESNQGIYLLRCKYHLPTERISP